MKDGKPAFSFADEGGWRDVVGDTTHALEATADERKRTKTALSNGAFGVTTSDAFTDVCLAKTEAEILRLLPPLERCATPRTPTGGATASARTVARAAASPSPPRASPASTWW